MVKIVQKYLKRAECNGGRFRDGINDRVMDSFFDPFLELRTV